MEKILLENKTIVTPGELIADGEGFAARDGSYNKGSKVYSSVVGIVNIKDNNIRVVKLGGEYNPQKDDYVVGIVTDMNFSNWFVDIGCPYDAGLRISEASRDYIDTDRYDMTHYFNYGDVIFAKIIELTESKKIGLTLKEPDLKKLEGGVLARIDPPKVPRLMGTKGSMVDMIEKKTKTTIYVGDNGYVWIKGNADDVKKVKEVISIINNESHISGLTKKIEDLLNKGGNR
ncbi:MAG: RNA-binding protein [Nanoarchaeota archaeon]|nr:RNA-binding protein [Nanoarchaeota archaeon]